MPFFFDDFAIFDAPIQSDLGFSTKPRQRWLTRQRKTVAGEAAP
jgi:hypothetical protein